MDLDTNIMQTKTIRTIVDVLIEIERELIIPRNKLKIAEIINKHEIAMTLIGSYRD